MAFCMVICILALTAAGYVAGLRAERVLLCVSVGAGMGAFIGLSLGMFFAGKGEED